MIGTSSLGRAVVAVLVALALAACGEDRSGPQGTVGPEPSAEAQRPSIQHVSDHAAGGHAGSDGHDASDAHDASDGHDEPDGHSEHAGHGEALPAGALPGDSLFHLASDWTDHDGRSFALPELAGRPSVFVMFYGDCTTACPLLVKAAEDIEAALPEELEGEIEFVMVTFATEADTPAKLKAYAVDKGLDRAGWRWLVGTPLQTRQLATMLGVQYRDLGNGMFAHSNVVTVLGRDGVPQARLEGLGVDLGPAIAALEAAVR